MPTPSGLARERRSDVLRDLVILWGGFVAFTALWIGFVSIPLSRYLAGLNPLEGSDPRGYAIAFGVMLFAILTCLVGGLSRQQASIDKSRVILPWHLFGRLRKVKAIPLENIRSIEFVGERHLGRVILTLTDGRKRHLTIADFENPQAAYLALHDIVSKPTEQRGREGETHLP